MRAPWSLLATSWAHCPSCDLRFWRLPRRLSENKDRRTASHSASCSPASGRCIIDGKCSLGSLVCAPQSGRAVAWSCHPEHVVRAQQRAVGGEGSPPDISAVLLPYQRGLGSLEELGQGPLGMEGTLVQLVGGLCPQHLQIQTPPPAPRLSRASASEPQHPFMPKIKQKLP